MFENKNPKASKLQNTIFAWLLGWPIVAVYLDGWHHHHLDSGTEALFNPFHIFLYLGVLCAGLFIFWIIIKNKGLPQEYKPGILGIFVFIIAAALDLTWHHIFGFEESVDALLSPPHMLLAFGGLLAVSCLLRPLWHKQRDKYYSPLVPVLGFTYFYLVFVFFVQYCHPYYQRWLSIGTPIVGGVSYVQAAALSGALLRTIIFCGLLFSTLKYFKFPKGSLFLILFLEGVGICFMGGQFQYLYSAIVAGFLTEFVYHTLYDSLHKHNHIRLFGFLIPLVFFIPYIVITLMYDPTWWSIHMVLGEVFVNGLAGWLLTYLVEPPKVYNA